MGLRMNEQQAKIIIRLLQKISRQLADNQQTPNRPNSSATTQEKKDNRVARAVVAIARGASTYQAIADELGVTRGTVSKNPAIRRAMESAVRDRRPADKHQAEEFKFQKGR